ncbi:MAG: PIN domain-containing protein [Verrucomicrobiales bacterium]
MHFVDTNLLVYVFDESDTGKRDRARLVLHCLWEGRKGRLSHQVLQEFYATVTRKLKPALPRPLARAEVEDLLVWNPVSASSALLSKAWHLEDRYGLSCWDSLIVAAALAQNCVTLLTEDLQDGLEIEGLLVLNPFAPNFDLTRISV